MSPRAESWCIVGGGILGMTLAWRLAGLGRNVTLFEGAPNLGGLADAWTVGPVRWDRHYHVTLLSDTALRNLLAEIGLEKRLQFTTTHTEFYGDGKFYPLDNAIDFLRFPLLSFIGKCRLAGTILWASRISDGAKLERIPVEAWLTRLSGKQTFDRLWRPLLRAKLGANYKKASAAFIWSVIRRLYAARRSGLKTEKFGTVEGGYGEVLEAFASALKARGVSIKTGVAVRSVRRAGNAIEVTEGGVVHVFDRAILTVASPIVAQLAPDLAADEHAKHKAITYQGIVCASLVLSRPLHGRYLTYIADEGVPFTAVVEMSSLTGTERFGGNTLVYLPAYVTADDPLFHEPDETIQDRFVTALLQMYPELQRKDILAFKISRVRNVLAVSTLNYSQKLPPRRTSIEGLYVVNSAQIVNGTLNVDETIRLADAAIADIVERGSAMQPIRAAA